MEFQLNEANRKEISRRLERWDFNSLSLLANQATTAAGGPENLVDGDTATATAETKGTDGATLTKEAVVLTWKAPEDGVAAWWLTSATREYSTSLDPLSQDFPPYFP